MHGGVNFEPYKNQFKKLIPSKKMNYLEGYNASEGFFAIQDKMNSEGLLLMLDHGIFYEFIDMNNDQIINVIDVLNTSKYLNVKIIKHIAKAIINIYNNCMFSLLRDII